jgi:hypothetical protein
MPMPYFRRKSAPAARVALAWGFVCFAGLQLVITIALETRFPAWRDAECGCKLDRLRQCLAAAPGRPLMLVLGSSRAGMGFRPDALPPLRPAQGEPPVVYNYAFTGAGPVGELVRLRGLLHEGIRPDWIIFEIHPALLHQEEGGGEEGWLNVERLSWTEFQVVRRYSHQPWSQCRKWVRSRLTPCFAHRFCIISHVSPGWLPWGDIRQDGWLSLGITGWAPYGKERVTPEEYRRGVEFALHQYAICFQHFHITAPIDRALREALDLCRQEGIHVLLLTMPEGKVYQSWYGPDALAQINAYVSELSRQYRAPWIDARSWCSDDCFFDNHHLLSSGAAVFSERFGREVLQPLVEDPGRWDKLLANSPGDPTPR